LKIFISYSETDIGTVETIEGQLKNHGILVLRDKEFLKSGDEWEDEINKQIKLCDIFLVVVSKNSISSINVTREVIKANEFNKPIYPFVINKAPNFPILENLQHHQYKGTFEESELESIFNIPSSKIERVNDDDLQGAINSYKLSLRKVYGKLNVLNNREMVDILDGYVDCFLQYGIEYDDSDDTFVSNKLIDTFDGNLFIVTGHPGTGKTSLLNYFVFRLSAREFSYFPIHVSLKNYSPNFMSFEDYIDSTTGNLLKKYGLIFFTNHFNCVLLLDGLDEAVPEAYESIKKEIHRLRAEYALLTIVVTTRINGFKNVRELDYPNAKVCTIVPLNEGVIKKYINLWFKGNPKNANDISDIILGNNQFRELAEKAIFMLSLMCIVYQEGGALTPNVSMLYKKAVNHLLNTRNGVCANERALRAEMLKILALRFLQMQQRSFDSHLVEAIVQSSISGKTTKKPIEFINDLIDNTGLLLEYDGKYSFVHLTFQEYFVAVAAIEGKVFSEASLLDFNAISMWEETFKLYIGLLTDEFEKERFLKILSTKNLSLTLRVITKSSSIVERIRKDIIVETSLDEKLRMIEEIKHFLITSKPEVAKKMVIDTLKPLIEFETNSVVLYHSIQLLKKYDPNDSAHIMYDTFYKYQDEKFNELSSDKSYLFEMINIPAGSFIMGDDSSVDFNEKPAHKVNLKSFSISKYQLSNKAFERIMNLSSTRRHQDYSSEDNQPVINVDWFDAYICALRVGCRLPSEAEWEYAARATTTTRWWFGDDEEKIAENIHCYESKAAKTRDVNEGLPNPWGLYNVHGNVWEWCNDWFDHYSDKEQTDPVGSISGTMRARRGGGWQYHARGCKSSFRYGNEPNYKYNDIGIRLAK